MILQIEARAQVAERPVRPAEDVGRVLGGVLRGGARCARVRSGRRRAPPRRVPTAAARAPDVLGFSSSGRPAGRVEHRKPEPERRPGWPGVEQLSRG